MNHLKFLAVVIPIVLITFFGCVNYEQKTSLKEDGSGSMNIHYWTSMKNFSMGTTIGKFDFDEEKAIKKYSSQNTTVKSIKIEDNLDDSTKHVRLELDFKDISKLPEAQGFDGVNATWADVSDGMQLKYIVSKDTSAAKQMGAGEYDIIYEFTMPAEIVSTNGNKEGQTVKYSYKLSELNNDLEMIITVKKNKRKICGIIGLIFSTFIIGFAYLLQRRK